jgi:hypothetical protein
MTRWVHGNPACAGCHSLTDPVGFAFESYDNTARWRTSEEGTVIDASGVFHAADGREHPFGNALELIQLLAASEQQQECLTTEAGIETFGLGQLYISLGDPAADGAISARIYWKPFVLLIWLGPVLMALGGLLSLSDRRLRIGAPRRARASATVPAE